MKHYRRRQGPVMAERITSDFVLNESLAGIAYIDEFGIHLTKPDGTALTVSMGDYLVQDELGQYLGMSHNEFTSRFIAIGE